METIYSHIPLVPLRKEPDHRSEMVNQLLYGETAIAIDSINGWLLIKSTFDDYNGWIEEDSVTEADKELIVQKKTIIADPFIIVADKDNTMICPAGSEIPEPDSRNCFTIGKKTWCIKNKNNLSTFQQKGKITDTAFRFLFAPYLWGGRSVFGVDCSGFSQLIYKIHGKKIPRDAKDQINSGETIEELKHAQAGDLLFFKNDEGIVSHTGIMLDKDRIIHASKWVRVDRIDSNGIYNVKSSKYTHNLTGIRRVR